MSDGRRGGSRRGARPSSDRPSSERSGSERPSSERSGAGRPSAGRHRGSGRPRRDGSEQQRSAQAPRERGRTGDPARRTAYNVMRAVSEGAYTNLELTSALRRARLDGRDAAFVTELVSGATRWRGRYDAIIAEAAGRPVTKIDPPVLDTLRLGAHQILAMRVPEHAAVGETVALARSVNGIGASKLVNAALRRISERTLEEWLDVTVPETEGTARLAVLHSHPEWIVKALRQALIGHGAATAETADAAIEALLTADNEPPELHIVARPGLGAEDDLREAGAAESDLAPTAWVLGGGNPGRISAIRDGRAAVQDAGSQLLALALARAPLAGPALDADQRWLDLCAGPGGKAGLLAALAIEAGADLVANEISEHRADLVRATLEAATDAAAAQDVSITVRTADGREVGENEPHAYTRVLVDAPCTGLGALRRRPEARWRREPTDLATLGPLQRDLLQSALDATMPGGVVLYATCSPHLAETTFVVQDVLKKRDDVEVLDVRELFQDRSGAPIDALGVGPAAQLWPNVHGTDAMFASLLRKRID